MRRLEQLQQVNTVTTFSWLSRGAIAALFVALVYFNFVMLQLVFAPLLFAAYTAICVDRVHTRLLAIIARVRCELRLYWQARGFLVAVSATSVSVLMSTSHADLTSAAFGTLVASILCLVMARIAPIYTSALLMSLLVFLLSLFPIYFVLRACARDAASLTAHAQVYVSHHASLIADVHARITDTVEMFGLLEGSSSGAFDPLELVRLASANASAFFTSALRVAQNVSNFVTSLIVFYPALYYMLVFKQPLLVQLRALSPLPRRDTARLLGGVQKSVLRIVQSTVLVGAAHALTTFLVLTLTGFPVVVLLSVVAGFLAIIPVASSWLVYAPVCIALYVDGAYSTLACAVTVCMATTWYLTPLLYGAIPAHIYIVGLAIPAGMSAFGPVGVLTGPLLTTSLLTARDIFLEYRTVHSNV